MYRFSIGTTILKLLDKLPFDFLEVVVKFFRQIF